MLPINQVLQGDCTRVLRQLPDECVDLIVTDPPYGVHYQGRFGRTVANDDDPSRILGAFTDLYRVLKPNSLCVSFYGWSFVDEFFLAWRSAGFRPVGHIVWVKEYASRTRFLRYRHEQAYLLAKGHPALPAEPIDDVRPWVFSGNADHPTQKAVRILTPLIEAFTRRGSIVLDPFAGSGSTLVAAAITGRRYLGIELEHKYCALARGPGIYIDSENWAHGLRELHRRLIEDKVPKAAMPDLQRILGFLPQEEIHLALRGAAGCRPSYT